MPALESIPTNVITGFLGAGKSTAILQLLRQKPGDKRYTDHPAFRQQLAIADMIVTTKADNVLTDLELDDCLDSRIECISASRHSLEGLENALLDCVAKR